MKPIIGHKSLLLSLSLLPVATGFARAQGSTTTPQKTPLEWANLLLQEVKPADSSYTHKNGVVRWQSSARKEAAQSHTDCSGLLNTLLSKSYGLTRTDFKSWLGTYRPVARSYHDAIVNHDRFARIDSVKHIRPGDIIAIKYPSGSEDTGHIMLVTAVPEERKPTEPYEEETGQWGVQVVDSAMSGHGIGDTRHLSDTGFRQGLGEGTFRLYSDPEGTIVGYAWSNSPKSKYYDLTVRHLVVGRYLHSVASIEPLSGEVPSDKDSSSK